VQNYGEDDFLSHFLSGPFLKLFHRFWYRHKVRNDSFPDHFCEEC
jgi:hypothetical protein